MSLPQLLPTGAPVARAQVNPYTRASAYLKPVETEQRSATIVQSAGSYTITLSGEALQLSLKDVPQKVIEVL